jgi:hypothetical protein
MSLRVGVVGPSALASLLATVMREYGRHRVLGYRLGEVGDPPIANAPDPATLVKHVDLVYLLDTALWSVISRASLVQGASPVMVCGKVVDRYALYVLCQGRGTRRGRPYAYSPITWPHRTEEELANPDQIWVAGYGNTARDLVEQAWRPIINTVPVVKTGVGRVSQTGLLLPPAASEAKPAMSTRPPARRATRGT